MAWTIVYDAQNGNLPEDEGWTVQVTEGASGSFSEGPGRLAIDIPDVGVSPSWAMLQTDVTDIAECEISCQIQSPDFALFEFVNLVGGTSHLYRILLDKSGTAFPGYSVYDQTGAGTGLFDDDIPGGTLVLRFTWSPDRETYTLTLNGQPALALGGSTDYGSDLGFIAVSITVSGPPPGSSADFLDYFKVWDGTGEGSGGGEESGSSFVKKHEATGTALFAGSTAVAGDVDGPALSTARFTNMVDIAYTWDPTMRINLNRGNRFYVLDDHKIKMIHLCDDSFQVFEPLMLEAHADPGEFLTYTFGNGYGVVWTVDSRLGPIEDLGLYSAGHPYSFMISTDQNLQITITNTWQDVAASKVGLGTRELGIQVYDPDTFQHETLGSSIVAANPLGNTVQTLTVDTSGMVATQPYELSAVVSAQGSSGSITAASTLSVEAI